MNLHVKQPCKNCPFRKDSLKGWLGEKRATEISKADSFVCHKTLDTKKERKQCAGHLHLKGFENKFFLLAYVLKIDLGLKNREIVFANEKEFIEHHTK